MRVCRSEHLNKASGRLKMAKDLVSRLFGQKAKDATLDMLLKPGTKFELVGDLGCDGHSFANSVRQRLTRAG